MLKKSLLYLGAGLLLPALAATSAAAEPLEEIVVTAGFREAELLESVGSVSVVEAARIRERGGIHLEDTLHAVPNVNFSSAGGRARFVQVRGVGELEQFVDPKHFPSVGVTVDGVELIGVASAATLMDVEQVEVLRGPQGTRFGSSALAGMVNIQTRDPGPEVEGRIEAGYGNYDRWYLEAAAGGPLSERLQGRVAVRQAKNDGYMKNAFLDSDETDNHDELIARGKLRWLASEDLTADFTATWTDLDNGYDAFTLDNSRTSLADEPGEDSQELLALSAEADWQVTDALAVEALLTYTDSDERYAFDEDWVFQGFCDGVRCDPAIEFSSFDAIDRDRQVLSADLRVLGELGPWRWVAGLYTQHRDQDLRRERFGVFESRYQTERYAAYGELSYLPAPRWELTAGLRVERFEDEYSDSNAFDTGSADTYWSGELSASYRLREDVNLYATVARGAKPGGVNTEASSVRPFMQGQFQAFLGPRLRFSKETVLNKELGLKGRFLDDRLIARAAAFHMKRSDAQLESWMWDGANFIWVGILDNVADAENYGAELELELQASDRLQLFGSLGLMETNVERITTFDLDLERFVERRDRDQTKASPWQYNTGARFDFGRGLSAGLEVEGRAASFFGYYHNEKLDGYSLVNANVRWERDNLTVRLWGRNLLDEDYEIHGLFFANDPRDAFTENRAHFQFGEPRVYGVTANWRF